MGRVNSLMRWSFLSFICSLMRWSFLCFICSTLLIRAYWCWVGLCFPYSRGTMSLEMTKLTAARTDRGDPRVINGYRDYFSILSFKFSKFGVTQKVSNSAKSFLSVEIKWDSSEMSPERHGRECRRLLRYRV